MTAAVLSAVGGVLTRWAQADPAADLIRSGYAQLGFLALLLAGGWWEIRQANKRTEQERVERKEAEARERKQAEVVLPALQEANRALEMMARLTERETPRR
jgi:hypothetical protein